MPWGPSAANHQHRRGANRAVIAKSRRAGAPALGLSIAAVVISGLSAVLVIIMVAAALGSGGSSDTADAGTPAAVPAAPTPQTADTEVPADAATVTCDSIIPDIVSVTPSNPVLAIYEAETVANHVDAAHIRGVEIPERNVVVIAQQVGVAASAA